jgi:hypothetical protein
MKRWFSGLLAAVMVLLLLPASASGEDPKYYVSLGSTATSAEVNKPVSVALFMHQEPGDLTYNTFFFQFSYDAEKLDFANAAIGNSSETPAIINDNSDAGLLTIGGYGEVRSDRFITLNFTVKAAGEATVKLVKAQMDVRANAAKDAQTASVPAGQSNTVTILCGGFPVVLPDCATGAAYVTENGDYTFTADPSYNYDFSATVNNEKVDIINNDDGSYTIENVTGKLVIKANSAPTVKTYAVTVKGDGSGDVSAPTSATHGQNYTFTVTQAANYDYAVAVTVNGLPVTCTVSNSGSNAYTYTIPATSVTGPVVITVKKTLPSGTTMITFNGNGASDEWQKGVSRVISNGSDFDFCTDQHDGFDYSISAAGQSGIIPVSETGKTGEIGVKYTISGQYITGGIITITINKAQHFDWNVIVSPYVNTDGSTIWLITASPDPKPEETKSLYYGGKPMFWSEKYKSYAWLLLSSKSQDTVKADAEAAITIKENAVTSIEYGGDVNGTGRIDINDAQYIYDLYNAKHSTLDMEKFLRCDVNGNREVNVEDVRMVVSLLLR